jgi:hypothetical protein
MPEFCTCGAELPPDALFCHKCGKPQREIMAPEEQPEPPPRESPESAPLPPRREALPLNFQNPVALRIAIIVAIASTLLNFVVPFLTWVAGGFFAVMFYRRRTGSFLNVNAGVRLGWITGLLTFVLSAIVFTIQVLPHLNILIEQQIRNLPTRDPVLLEQMKHFFNSGPGIATALMFSLGAMFILITLLTVAGGALGAKVMGRN